MRDAAMIFDDCERVARDCVGDCVDIREDGAERCGKNGDAAVTVGEIALAKKRAGDAVGYRIHLQVEEEKLYTMREDSKNLDERVALGDHFADDSGGNPAPFHRCPRGVCGAGRYRGEQAAGRLRIK